MQKILDYIKENKKRFMERWFEALRIPSVSSQSEHRADIDRMAEWLANYLRNDLGLSTKIIQTSSHPLVYAESPKIPGKPTVLLYGHYDVQPPEPFDEWKIDDPFDPKEIDGYVYGRGADDDKGQLLTHLFALKAYKDSGREFPLQFKFIYEGEEEVNSAALHAFLQEEANRTMLQCDVIVVSDNTMAGPGQPAISYGLRGLLACELFLKGPNRDLHSGLYGGSVCNPVITLARLINSLIDENGIIQVPEFYDDVIKISDKEHRSLAEVPFDEKTSLAEIGLDSGFGDARYTTVERRCARPAMDVNGITGGYQGEGPKTIIPSVASAKITFRLVPNQEPGKIWKNLVRFLEKQIPPGIKMDLRYDHGACGMVVSLDSPYMQKAANALEQTFGKKPYFVRDGGSITIVTELKNQLNADLLLIGFGLDEDAIHSPNERFPVDSFMKGMETSARLWQEFVS